MKACTVYIIVKRGPDKDRNITDKGLQCGKRLMGLLYIPSHTSWETPEYNVIERKSIEPAKLITAP
jgi:hypothetical protein